MVNFWVIPAILGVSAILGLAAWFRGRSGSSSEVVYVAHTAMLRSSRRFRRRLNCLRLGVAALAACALLAVLSASVLVARPSYEKVSSKNLSSRDIVLCLDVSGSVIDFDAEVLETFSKMVEKFEGERVGLVIFNSSARVVFPLTDDYDMIQKELKSATAALSSGWKSSGEDFQEFITGTVTGSGASLIGDGLVSCTHSFDYKEKDRSRTILFATDNELAGKPLFQLNEACDMARRRDIRVYGLLITGGYSSMASADEFSRQIKGIGGTVYEAGDSSAGQEIVEKVQAQDEAELASDVDTSIVDKPELWPVGALVGVLGIILFAWRFRLS